jgi:hypothetical protein
VYNAVNNGSIRLGGATFLDSYVGHERFEISFSNSLNFEVSGEDVGYIGIGTNDEEFSCQFFSISPSDWSGIAQQGDTVFFTSNSDVSVNDATAFIDDAGNYIENRLGTLFGDSTNIPWNEDPTIQIPGGLGFAAIRLAAYYIYTAAIAGTIIDQEAPVEVAWNRAAEKAIDAFIEWYRSEAQISSPRWRSRGTLFDQLGISGVDETDTGRSGEIDLNSPTDIKQDKSYRRN